MRRLRFGLAALFFGAGLAGGALAQQPPAGLDQLHDALHLSAAQEPAWRAYTSALTSNEGAEARHHATQQLLPTLPTPRRIALIDATMEQDLVDLRRQGQAVDVFYNQLTPQQQQVFDRQTLRTRTGDASQ